MSDDNKISRRKVPDGDSIKDMAMLPSSGAFVSMGVSKNEGAKPTTPVYSDDSENDSSDHYLWGGDNDWPTKARKKLEASTSAYPLIFKAVCLLSGDGVFYYREVIEGEKIKKDLTRIPEIDTFFLQNDIDEFLLEQLMDFKFYGNAFCYFIFKGDMSSIVSLYHLEAEYTRLKSKTDTDTFITHLLYSGGWSSGGGDDAESIELLNKRKSGKEELKERHKKSKKFAMHTKFPSPGRSQYAMPPHAGLYRDGGWLDFANSVPEIMNALVKNQITLKYHIKIPSNYWKSQYKDWLSLSQQKQDELINKKLQEMDEWLSDKTNTGKSFISHFATDPVTGKKVSGWEIEAIDDKVKKDAYIPSVQEADSQISRAIGLDSSLSGLQPQGGKMGAGSGSDKRVGFQNSIALTKAEQMIIFKPLYLIAKYNGWPSDIKFGFKHQEPTKLDDNPTGSQTTG